MRRSLESEPRSRRFGKWVGVLSLVWTALFVLSIFSFGQSVATGTLSGVVSDPSGAVVPGATVALTDNSTGATRTVTTTDTGRYVFSNVTPGSYNISVTKTGFANAKINAQTISVGQVTTVNVPLKLGGESQVVEVQTTGVELQMTNATVGNTINTTAIANLPSLGRDVSTFVTLQPGVSPDGSVAGTVVDQSSFQLDGGNNTNDMDGSMNVYTPSFAGDPTGGLVGGGPTGVMPTPADSVEEFKVNTANQTADFNSSSGAQVQVVTKRGTNSWHGSAYEYYLDNNFSANTWDNNLTGTKQPDYHYSRFGGSVGGPLIPKEILGGKTYFFANYQGFRWPNSTTIERAVPTQAMRNGLLTFSGVTYNMKAIDPRGIGINPTVQQMWASMPLPNDPGCGSLAGARCDGVNTQGYKANMAIPQSDNFGVARIDHDFSSKWHFMSSYRYYRLTRAVTSQIDIGGLLGGAKGVPTSVASRPQQPWYFVAGLNTNITSNTTNDFHFSYLRNYWSWSDAGGAPQLAGLGGALEPLGERHYDSLTPYNVDTQDIRTRFWDGHDYFFRDDVSMLKGNHLFTFGGSYERNWDYHQRTDNGGGIDYYTVYQLGDSSGAGLIDLSSLAGFPTSSAATRMAAAVYGMVTDSQVAYTRTGANLALNPPLTPAFDKSTIPYYNVYFSDTWHMKPTFTLTYGLGWALEMPPVEEQGKQVELVDQSGQPVDILSYLNQRKSAALKGQVFNPVLGYALVGNTAKGLKYPYNPFYGGFSPRIAVAWNPKASGGILGHFLGDGNTVIRAGYGRIFGRLNGVDLVLVPLLGTGLLQPVQCRLALSNGQCGPTTPTAATAFRIGVDGKSAPLPTASPTLPQPLFPGINDVSAAAGEALDPNFRPNHVDSFDFTIQRQLTNKMSMEVGYIGRFIHDEYQPINTNAVPYMMTLGGQRFDQAYAAIETAMGCMTSSAACGANGVPAVAPQPFFEAALSGTGYCNGYANCTTAVVTKQFSKFANQQVWSLWSALDKGGVGGGPGGTTVPGFNFPRSMLNSPLPTALGANGQISGGVGVNASVGYGNYNAGFVTMRMTKWHGVTAQSNFTFSKALGTGAFVQATSEYTPNDAFDLSRTYGLQGFDRTFVFNQFIVWEPEAFKNQHGLLGHVLGGWAIAPIFTAGSGAPLYCNTQTDAQAFGSGDGANFFDNEQCLNVGSYKGGNSVHAGVVGGTDSFKNDVGTNVATDANGNPKGVNMFANPVAVWNQFRPPILGIDRRAGGLGPIRGLPYWNMDLSLRKSWRVTERFGAETSVIFTNVLNHMQFANPTLDISDPTSWGVLNTQGNSPRQMEFGLRLTF